MERIRRYIIIIIRKRRPRLLMFFALVYIAYFIIIFNFLFSSFALTATLVIFPLAVFEILIRSLLLFAYGRRYRFAIFNYFFVNHKIYGHAFRKSINSAEIDFPIFDRFIFKKEVSAASSLLSNKNIRVKFAVNSLGFRGAEFSKKKKPGAIRIFCSGGSTTAGNSVDDDETWPAALEREFHGTGRPVEVINAGVQGWDSYQELQRFLHEIVEYDPDVILLHQGWNEETAYTSQNLGKWWRPKVVRNVVEARYLFCGKHPILSNTRSLLFFFIMHLYFYTFLFCKNMKFSNPRRWKSLASERYIAAWLDNIAQFAKEAAKRNILLYTVNYPGLYDMNDSPATRDLYAKSKKNAPASMLAMDYQAILKKRIEKTLLSLNPLVPCVNVEKNFADVHGDDRLELFIDDVHMSPAGNKILGENICQQLIRDECFKKLLRTGSVEKSNAQFEKEIVEKIRKKIGINDDAVERFIGFIMQKISQSAKKGLEDTKVPTDRYVTF